MLAERASGIRDCDENLKRDGRRDLEWLITMSDISVFPGSGRLCIQMKLRCPCTTTVSLKQFTGWDELLELLLLFLRHEEFLGSRCLCWAFML